MIDYKVILKVCLSEIYNVSLCDHCSNKLGDPD